MTYLDVSKIVPLDCGDAAALVEADLPYTREVSKEIADTFTIADIPHLQRAIGARNDFLPIVLEASDCTSVSRQGGFTSARFRVPNPKSRIGSSRHQTIATEVKQTDK